MAFTNSSCFPCIVINLKSFRNHNNYILLSVVCVNEIGLSVSLLKLAEFSQFRSVHGLLKTCRLE